MYFNQIVSKSKLNISGLSTQHSESSSVKNLEVILELADTYELVPNTSELPLTKNKENFSFKRHPNQECISDKSLIENFKK